MLYANFDPWHPWAPGRGRGQRRATPTRCPLVGFSLFSASSSRFSWRVWRERGKNTVRKERGGSWEGEGVEWAGSPGLAKKNEAKDKHKTCPHVGLHDNCNIFKLTCMRLHLLPKVLFGKITMINSAKQNPVHVLLSDQHEGSHTHPLSALVGFASCRSSETIFNSRHLNHVYLTESSSTRITSCEPM